MSKIEFKAKIVQINSVPLLLLPAEKSALLPSRGQVMANVTVNKHAFQSPLEPDGNGSHWLNIDEKIQTVAGIKIGEQVAVTIEATKNWPEPKLPTDFESDLKNHEAALQTWKATTPMARWEWLRWIDSTANAITRQHRIEVAYSKLSAGERRPCCFNRSMCCVPAVSKNGRLIEPTS